MIGKEDDMSELARRKKYIGTQYEKYYKLST